MASSENSRTDEELAALWPPHDGAPDDGAPDDGALDDDGLDGGALDTAETGDGRLDSAASIRRIAVYCVLVLALVVVMWALIEGGERDLWSPTAAVRSLQAMVFCTL